MSGDYGIHIEHRTSYTYEKPVRFSKNEVRMTPAQTAWQQITASFLRVDPEPTHRVAYRDYFGTAVEMFEVATAHDRLEVIAVADVSVSYSPSPDFPPPDVARASEYLPQSPMIAWDAALRATAHTLRRSTDGATVRSVVDWVRSTMRYEPGTTEVGTPVSEVLEQQHGVCQDFAHLTCALLRSLEIPARYVSGYFAPKDLEPGETVQAESHAWIEALVEGTGWLPADPTNDVEPGPRHVKVGHGRDYTDVVPFQGIHAVSASQTLDVAVSISRTR